MQNKLFFLVVAILVTIFLSAHFYKKSLMSDFNYYANVEILPGTYRPWEPVEYSYQSYSGEPGIDDPAFLEKEDAGCFIYGTGRLEEPMEIVQKWADRGSVDAMYELYLRLPKNDPNKERMLFMAAAAGHLEARLLTYLWVGDIKNAKSNMEYIAEHYESITPLATYIKMVLGSISGNTDLADIERAKTAGGSYGIVAHALVSEIKYAGQIDKELFCESYYRGCMSLLYEHKQKHGVLCAE
jgi:hypothetical protein